MNRLRQESPCVVLGVLPLRLPKLVSLPCLCVLKLGVCVLF